MNSANSKQIKIQELHREACDQERDFYIDPETGYQVMTAYFLKSRGYCCKSGCRHCPYGFHKKGNKNVSESE